MVEQRRRITLIWQFPKHGTDYATGEAIMIDAPMATTVDWDCASIAQPRMTLHLSISFYNKITSKK
jgi:hypothetical protein